MAAATPIPKLKRNEAEDNAKDSPGVFGGNIVQAPIEVPVNLCGDTITVVGALNPTH
ncbi:1529_t:CDS:1, partial [Ambispora leptoticha]